MPKTRIDEAAYKGNIGVMELAKFHSKASAQDKAKFSDLMKKKAGAKNDAEEKQMAGEIWDHVQKVTGMKLLQMESATPFATYKEALLEVADKRPKA